MAPTTIGELLLFGTGALGHFDDPLDTARFYAYTVGTYYIAQNDRGETTTFVREFQMTAEQMELEFGKENMSTQAQTALTQGPLSWFPVVHFIEENHDYIPGNVLAKRKKFSSTK